jgi:hypothetical protein
MEAMCSSETSNDFQRTTGRYVPEDSLRYILRFVSEIFISEDRQISVMYFDGGVTTFSQSIWPEHYSSGSPLSILRRSKF